MKRRYKIILEILIVLVVAGIYFVIEVVPQVQKEKRFSNIISSKDYTGMIEFKIDDVVDFAVIFNQKNQIYHIFYFDNTSTCIKQEQVVSYKSLDKEILSIVEGLVQYHLLKDNSSVTLITYDTVPSEFVSILQNSFQKYSISSLISEEKSTLKEKAISLEIDEENQKLLLYELDFYSKNILSSEDSPTILFDKKSSLNLSNEVYLKLEKYVLDHHIQNMEKEQKEISIETISADEYHLYYPNSHSWFYVLDGKIYAYIEFTHQELTYGYCYQGSIDLKKEGEC